MSMKRQAIALLQQYTEAIDPASKVTPAEHRSARYKKFLELPHGRQKLEKLRHDESNPSLRTLIDLLLQIPPGTDAPPHLSAPGVTPYDEVTLSGALNALRTGLSSFLSNYRATRRLGIHASPSAVMPGVEIRNAHQISAGRNLVVKRGTILNGRSQSKFGLLLGPDTYIKEGCYIDSYGGVIEFAGTVAIGQQCIFDGGGGIEIGEHVMFGAHCYVISSSHRTSSADIPYIFQGDKSAHGVKIGSNVFIGGGSILLDGADIGAGSVVGAGSIVTRTIPPSSVYADRSPKLIVGALRTFGRDRHG